MNENIKLIEQSPFYVIRNKKGLYLFRMDASPKNRWTKSWSYGCYSSISLKEAIGDKNELICQMMDKSKPFICTVNYSITITKTKYPKKD
jgi:hypothetical protein